MENLEVNTTHSRRIAVLGSTSVLALDYMELAAQKGVEFLRFSRSAKQGHPTRQHEYSYSEFETMGPYKAVINFIGFGSPKRAAAEWQRILEVTDYYDEKVLDYLQCCPDTTYIFISSGAAGIAEKKYGLDFFKENTVDSLARGDLYGFAKFRAETRHRSQENLSIFDVRVFNYVSTRQTVKDGFLFTDIWQALKNEQQMTTSTNDVLRDFSDARNLEHLLSCLVSARGNRVIDLYSSEPVTKFALLSHLEVTFGLKVDYVKSPNILEPTGAKSSYVPSIGDALKFGYVPVSNSVESVEAVLFASGAKPRNSL